jgi:hypothetical protein
VQVPESCFQVEFVTGDVIPILGPAGSSNFYGSLGRLIDTDTDGPDADGCACGSADSAPPAVAAPAAAAAPASYSGKDIFASGVAAGAPPVVRVFDAMTAALRAIVVAYSPDFAGGVRVATGDVDGDGYDDLITVAGPGAASHVKVFSGVDFHVIRSFFAYDPAFTGGVSLAVGDVNGDGAADIITGADAGGGPHVKVFRFDDLSVESYFFAFDPSFAAGLFVAAGDTNGDGRADVMVSGDLGSLPVVRVFDGESGSLMSEFAAFGAGFLGGVRLAATDFNGDGRADVVAGSGVGSTQTRVLDPANLGGVFVG